LFLEQRIGTGFKTGFGSGTGTGTEPRLDSETRIKNLKIVLFWGEKVWN
jgi:hypothetical protein